MVQLAQLWLKKWNKFSVSTEIVSPFQLSTRAELSVEISNKWYQDPEAFLPRTGSGDEMWLFTMILKANTKSFGYQEVQWSSQSKSVLGKSKVPGNRVLECSRHFAFWLSGRPKNDTICLLGKVSQSFRRRTREASPESLSTMIIFWFIPLIKGTIL